MRTFAVCITLLCLTATLMPLIPSPYWWIRIFDFTRLQVAVLSLVATALVMRFRPAYWAVQAGLLAGAVFYQASYITDYTPLKPTQAKSASDIRAKNRVRLLVCNIRMENRDAVAFVDLVRRTQPDLVLVNEPDAWWTEQLRALHPKYPHRLLYPLPNTYGMGLFSRFPLLDSRVRFLVEPDVPSLWTAVRLPTGNTFDLYCLHPRPPKPGTQSYERDAELLLVGRHLRQTNRPAVVAGDMNDVGWSRTSRLFQRYSGLVDPRRGRGLYNTYSTFVPLFRYPLDHVFYSDVFGLLKLERLPSVGSDHFPMLVELSYEPQTDNTRNAPKREAGDARRVREKIRKGREE